MGRAIVREPKVFLMDEPLSNLDAKLRVQMRTEIAKLHERLGATMIYVTPVSYTHLLSNNLINLGIYNEIKSILNENGKSLSEVEEVEPEPSLGNGGLGRLAACFLDSIATLGPVSYTHLAKYGKDKR